MDLRGSAGLREGPGGEKGETCSQDEIYERRINKKKEKMLTCDRYSYQLAPKHMSLNVHLKHHRGLLRARIYLK